MFRFRSTRPERIDTGDYTDEEYRTFMREIRFINQKLCDRSALEKTLLAEIERVDLREFSVLDVGAGSGELLAVIADFARESERHARLLGLDLNELSAREIAGETLRYPEIAAVRGDALRLPFDDDVFDYCVCSLFTHHLTDKQIPLVLAEMSRVARRGIVVIDLERSAVAWGLYRLFCFAYRISPLVRHDGLLSIRKGFRTGEFDAIGRSAGLKEFKVCRQAPYRVVMSSLDRDR
jgi:ubiquinone/menaquinone biosynthesis C-methylase UbiE